ncbi:MAG: CoA pyrophosphatase [SAR86 cluster bacterium]|uniref:CoA pyrophosphatase n=1 Tax=SAR86 cluster bacterium TaxID=2030880 RepID=A0A520MSA0_9GAMM|nr:MAG: CoA pyrophosphatase [SAR86 cluster bacterium]
MLDSIKQKLEQINLTDPTKYKKAGVLILLIKDNDDAEYKILFTKRSEQLKTHSGEVSFPGGKWEEGDSNLYQTALRESNEEINLDIENVTKLGPLNFLLSRHKIEVNPFVGYLNQLQDFKGNFEIDEIFTVPISFLMNEKNIEYKEFNRKDLKVYIPSWVYNGNRIWGLTAMIAADFLNICFDVPTKTDINLFRTYDEY